MRTGIHFVSLLLCLPAILFAQQTESLAILDFEGRGISDYEAVSLTDRLRSELVKTGEVTVVERGQMEQVLREQDFHLTGCTSNECAIEVGQLLGVTSMVAGAIGQVGSTFTLDIRVIDVETGMITRSLTRDYRGEIDGLLAEMVAMAGELAGVGVARAVGPVQQPVLKPQPNIQSSTATPRFQVAYGITEGLEQRQGLRTTGTNLRVSWYPWGERQLGSFILLPALTGGKYIALGGDSYEGFGTHLFYFLLEGSALRSFAGLGLGISYGIGVAFGDDNDGRYYSGPSDASGSANLISIITSYRISPFTFVVEAGVFESKSAFGGWIFSAGIQYYRM